MIDRFVNTVAPAPRGRQSLFRRIVGGEVTSSLLAGLGGFAVIFGLAELTARFGSVLLIAPFGASCVLVFGLPDSPLAQPRNVIGGHLISTAMGLLTLSVLGNSPLAFGIGVGLAIAAMLLTGTVHPPAGADPIVVVLAGAAWSFLAVPVLTGAVTIVVAGLLFRRFVLGRSHRSEMRRQN